MSALAINTQAKPRILHFIESEGVYGAERVILNLSQQLKAGADFTPVVGCIFASASSDNALYDAALQLGLEAVKIPIANARLLGDLPRAARQLQALNIDLIHSHGYKPSVFGFVVRLLTKIPVIATCHLWFQPNKGPLKMRVMIRLEKFFYRWFPKVIAVSEPIKQILLGAGLRPSQVDIVCNGVDTPSSSLNPEQLQQLRRELGLNPGDFCLLNSARLNAQKAQWVLVEAAALLRQQQLNQQQVNQQLPSAPVRFLIVGQGPLESELRAQIERLDLGDSVKLLGFRRDIPQLLQLCDAFVLPSIDEGMPMSLLEAAAAAKPIISTLVGDIGKLIRHEQTGLCIPLENPQALVDAIERLQTQPQLAQQLAYQAHSDMQRSYSSQAMAARYSDIYSALFQPATAARTKS